jgi:putative phage-type endonuclease
MSQAPQRSQQWHEARKAKITGSVSGAILGLNPYMTPDAVMRRLVRDYHGQESEFTGNIATEYGQLNEPMALLGFINKYGYAVDEVGFCVHANYAWLGASPDGIFENNMGEQCILEIKCPFGLRNDLLPVFKSIEQQPHYYAQLQVEMACTGLKQTYFYQWSQHGDSLEIVPFNQQWFNDNLPKLKAFYDEFLKQINNPAHLEPLVQSIDTREAIMLLVEYDQVCEAIDNAEQRKKELLEQLVKLADNKNAVIHGRKLTQISKAGAISYAKAIKELLPDADLSKYKGNPTTYWKLG